MRILALLALFAAFAAFAAAQESDKKSTDEKTDKPKEQPAGTKEAAAAAPAEDSGELDLTEDKPSPYAAMGFPVTMDGEIITENDVARATGTPLDQIPPLTLRRQLDILLNRKLSERIAADLEIAVPEIEVNNQMRLAVEERQGEARFFEYLAQRGITLERWRLDKRDEILEQKLSWLFQTGVAPNQRNLLPARVRPSPRERMIAWRHDTARIAGDGRVRRIEMVVDVDRPTRRKLAVQRAFGKTEKWVSAELERLAQPLLEAVKKEIEETSFEEVAKKRGVAVDRQAEEWLPITGDGPAEEFLKTGEEKSWIAITRPEGGYRLLYLIERENRNERDASDPEVAAEYDSRIRTLRASKWEAVLRIRALDKAKLEPASVRRELRERWLSALRESEQELRALGLH